MQSIVISPWLKRNTELALAIHTATVLQLPSCGNLCQCVKYMSLTPYYMSHAML